MAEVINAYSMGNLTKCLVSPETAANEICADLCALQWPYQFQQL